MRTPTSDRRQGEAARPLSKLITGPTLSMLRIFAVLNQAYPARASSAPSPVRTTL